MSARDMAWPGGQEGWTDEITEGWIEDGVEEERRDRRVVGDG